MRREDIHYNNTETGCCALINPADWDNRTYEWDNKKFIKEHVIAFLHMPLTYGKAGKRIDTALDAAEAHADPPLWLTYDTSAWGSDLYAAVDKEVPGADNVTLSGRFITKVFEGPYKETGTWMNEMNAYVRGQGEEVEQIYAFYTACPGCARHFGKNYVVLFAKVG
jgi:hypothetical protein